MSFAGPLTSRGYPIGMNHNETVLDEALPVVCCGYPVSMNNNETVLNAASRPARAGQLLNHNEAVLPG